MQPDQLQKLLIKQIKQQLPANVSFAEEIAQVLNISTDSAYRRIRAEKPLTIDEVQVLCTRYRVSLDKLMNIDSGSVLFAGNYISPDKFSFGEYLEGILRNMKAINSASQKMMWYEGKDMPIFHFFQYREMAAFKYFFWMKYVLSYPQYSKMKFEDNELMEPLLKYGMDIVRNYYNIPSAEIWSADSLNATLRQIEYYAYTGVFRKKETIEILYMQLEQLLEHICDMAEAGEKFIAGGKPHGAENLQFYFSEVFLGHNSVLAETEGKLTTFINHGVLHYMATNDEDFCRFTKESVENTMKKSLLISKVGDKERARFFNIMQGRINESKLKSLV